MMWLIFGLCAGGYGGWTLKKMMRPKYRHCSARTKNKDGTFTTCNGNMAPRHDGASVCVQCLERED
jgi:hypothetical protein